MPLKIRAAATQMRAKVSPTKTSPSPHSHAQFPNSSEGTGDIIRLIHLFFGSRTSRDSSLEAHAACTSPALKSARTLLTQLLHHNLGETKNR
jgi:hypothetical protein